MEARTTILLIEAEENLRRLLTEALEDHYNVLVCKDGVEGIKIYEKHIGQIAAVVTEFEMPRLQGDLVTEWIHRAKPELPVIILTRYPEGIYTKAMPDTARDPKVQLLRKPFEASQLLLLLSGSIAQQPEKHIQTN